MTSHLMLYRWFGDTRLRVSELFLEAMALP
jgi:hypothetical protein